MRAAILIVLTLAACDLYDHRYVCQRDAQCQDPGRPPEQQSGRCIAAGCAFPDTECASGYRFDASADPGQACVAPELDRGAAAGFTQVALGDGARDAASLTLLFAGADADLYVAGWDGRPLLLRGDGARLVPLAAPFGPDPPVAGAAAAGTLALATRERLFQSRDSGMSWEQQAVLDLQGLYHDGRTLHVLAGGKVFASGDPLVPAFTPQEARGVGLFGSGPRLFLLGLSDAGRGLVYGRDPADGTWRTLHQADAPLSAGWADPAGGYVAAGAGILVHGGQAVEPAPPEAPLQLAGRRADDLWAIGPWPYLLHRQGGTWRRIMADPQAQSYVALLLQPRTGQLFTISRFAGDRTYRHRLWKRAITAP
jgi:hypothetical protein